MDKADHDILKKIENIRRLLDEGRKLYRSTDQVSKNTYTYLRERLTSSSGKKLLRFNLWFLEILIIHAKHEVNLWKFTDVFLEDTIENVSSFLSGNDNRYATLAEQLRQRITDIKIKIDRQLRLLDALKSQVKDQVVVIQRLEVSKIFI